MPEATGEKPRDFATAVVLITPAGIPLVRDLQKAQRKNYPKAYLKFPGGKRKPEDKDEKAGAVRELLEEAIEEEGGLIDPEALIELYRENRGTHDFILFGMTLNYTPKFKKVGNEGEDVGVFSPEGLRMRRDVFPNHWIKPAIDFIYSSPAAQISFPAPAETIKAK